MCIVLTCRFQLSIKIIWFDLCTNLILRSLRYVISTSHFRVWSLWTIYHFPVPVSPVFVECGTEDCNFGKFGCFGTCSLFKYISMHSCTALNSGRPRVWFLMGLLGFFIDVILPATLCPGVYSTSKRNELQEYSLGYKRGRCLELTTLPHSCADRLEILGASIS
jgi:hypothetical protein